MIYLWIVTTVEIASGLSVADRVSQAVANILKSAKTLGNICRFLFYKKQAHLSHTQ